MEDPSTAALEGDLVARSVSLGALAIEVTSDVDAWKRVVTTDSFASFVDGTPLVLMLSGPVAAGSVSGWASDVIVVIQQMVAARYRVVGVCGDAALVAAVQSHRWPGMPQALPVVVLRLVGESRIRATGDGIVSVRPDAESDASAGEAIRDGSEGCPFDDDPASVRGIGIPTFEQDPGVPLRVLRRKVRSGEKVVNNGGDVHVYGTVGSGAEIHAAGSILVFGEAAGRLFAGRFDDRAAVVSCNSLRAELVSVTGLFATGDRLKESLQGRPVTVSVSGGRLLMTATPAMEPPEATASAA